MHIDGGILNVSFGVTLFTLLAYKLRALGKKYLIPYLIQQKIALKKRYAEILEKKKLVASTTMRIENQIKNREIEFILLEKKVQGWHTYLNHKYAERVKEQKRLIVVLNEKRRKQGECLTATSIAQEAMPLALQEALETLTEKYSGGDGALLLARSIEKLSIKQ